MSVSHNHRRKTVRQFKKKHGKQWLPKFREHADAIRKAQDGPFIGTLADLISPTLGELAAPDPVAGAVSP